MGSETSLTHLAIDTLKQHQSQGSDFPKLQQWIATQTHATAEEHQAATPCLPQMAHRLSEWSNVDSLLALRAENGWYKVVVARSLVEEVIDEALQGRGTAQE